MGSGGFYQPGYGYEEEGTKLHLKMMCLGKHWDPLSSNYGDHRPCDGAKPPNIPPEFHQLVHTAIAHSHALIHHEFQTPDPHKILPPMTPDICIVNFYSQNGRLGLHQVTHLPFLSCLPFFFFIFLPNHHFFIFHEVMAITVRVGAGQG